MLRRLLLISLISIVPIQAWAALDMSMKHQINGSGVEAQTQTQIQTFSHPCHQEGNSESSGSPDHASHTDNGECNSCALCMAFGFTLAQFFIGTTDFSQIYAPGQINFVSHDTSALKKPPIL
jgi:hypothetical protein